MTGKAPAMSSQLIGEMLGRVWERTSPIPDEKVPAASFAIVRVAEQENGWMVPRNAERQRRIETIHRGPRLLDASAEPPARARSRELLPARL